MSALDGRGPGGPAMALGSLGGPEANFLIDANDETRRLPQGARGAQGQEPATPLQKLVDFDEEVAAAILKQWIREGANA